MAENLNYDYNVGSALSYCPKNSADSCAKYGRLYRWNAAMDSEAVFSDGGKGCGINVSCSPSGTVRGVCPEGWHLPSAAEFAALIAAVGGESGGGKALKSTSGWYDDGNGTDAYGFSALPAADCDLSCSLPGRWTYFWSASESTSTEADYMELNYYSDVAYLSSTKSKRTAISVRCLKDID